jgi:hypothetical protein
VWAVGFGVGGSGLEVRGLGFGVWGLGLRPENGLMLRDVCARDQGTNSAHQARLVMEYRMPLSRVRLHMRRPV